MLKGLTVVSFESRMSLPLKRMLEKEGAAVLSAPALKEIPLENNTAVFSFFERLEKGEIDYLVLMTGVATRLLIASLETRFPKAQVLSSLSSKTKIVVRGPKPKAVCNLNKIPIAHLAPEPNTWREILATLDAEADVVGKEIVVLEYGVSNDEFLENLRKRGARVSSLPVYSWSLPDDLAPIHQAIDSIIAGQADFLVFTTQIQVVHLMQIVKERKVELPFRRALHRVGIASIGPVTSEKLSEFQIFPDVEANPNKNDALVTQVSQKAEEILRKKRDRADEAWVWGKKSSSKEEPLFLRSCRLEKTERPPLWLMRQAGRYMAEYHVTREGLEFLPFCKNSDKAAEATLTALERLGVDAAIIFADILLPVEPMGLKLDYKKGEGPVISNPVRSVDDVAALVKVNVKDTLGYVPDACRKVRSNLDPQISLIGFCGAPYTMAAYMIEGRSPKQSIIVKKFMHGNPEAWHALMGKIVDVSIPYLNAQVEAGCDVVQLFDSWVGDLSPMEYRTFVLPHSQRLIRSVAKGVPVIHFGTNTATILPLMKEAGGNILGIDWRCDPAQSWDQLGNAVGLQGNLDPLLLFCKPEVFLPYAQRILSAVGSRPGFIFNLGHGILPQTPVDHVLALVDFVKSWKKP